MEEMRKGLMISAMLSVCMTLMAETQRFCIVQGSKTASIIVDADDWKGVIQAARNLGDDVRKVTGVASQVDNEPMQVIDARRGLVDTFSEYTPQNLAVSKGFPGGSH